MSQRIVTQIETCCDICGIPIYGDPHPNKSIDSVFVDSKNFNVSVNIDIFEFGKRVDHLCPSCYKKLLSELLNRAGGRE